ncbi:aspartate/glutamate racemase family protein [Duganella violaceipulchra]|uniref:Amino acid racemase n=1 Tax=Duganella violaceipulchra TaxID=2849652 RepID=A0AA41L4A5_9BURK|nr:amino acid racemase [Duganella violaceicalia]MBV6322704.1 amino acid racemase [Duganella violaceicalia]MCP2010918.1 aspartate racemase [Duganella violaceicalia]
MMEKIGILGGMGSAAGLYFAQQLIALNTTARQDVDHVPFILYSDPHIPNRVEAFLNRSTNPAPSVVTSLDKLATLGANFGVVICNTAHIYFDEISDQVKMPLINMVENAVEHIEASFPQARVGLLATTATVKSGLYARYFSKLNRSLAIPDDDDQALLMTAIFDTEFGIKATGNLPSMKAIEVLIEVATRLRERSGATHLILGCTELSFAIQGHRWAGFQIIDPVKVLAQHCLDRMATARGNIYSIAA